MYILKKLWLCLLLAPIALPALALAGAIPLAVNLNSPRPIIVDGNGAGIYFGQVVQSPCSGELDFMPAFGGTLVQMSANAAIYDSGYCRGTDKPTFYGDSVVYGYGGYVSYNIDKVSTACGSGCTHLVQGLSGGGVFGTVGGDAIYSSGFTTLNAIPLTGGSSQTLAGGYFVRSTSIDPPNPNYSSGASGVYFVDYYSGNVYRVDLNTHAISAVLQSLPDQGSILTDSNNVYWSDFSDGNHLLAGAKSSSCALATCVSLFSGAINAFVADESETDNPGGSLFVSDTASLWRVSKAGVAQKIFAGSNVKVLQTDGAKIYFTVGSSLKTLPVNATATANPVNVASGVSPSSWTLSGAFYWTQIADESPGAGGVFYVAQQTSQLDSMQYTTSVSAAAENKCSAQAAVYSMLARTVLESEGQHITATGVKIDDFYHVLDSGDPCNVQGGGFADWAGNGTWQNPVQANVAFGVRRRVTASTDLTSLVQQGPVLLQGTKSGRWLLATGQATVPHGSDHVQGVSAYDPLSGSRVLLQYDSGAGRYAVVLILDPRANTWCAWTAECPNLVRDIRTTTLKFIAFDLGVIQDFVPKYYTTATVRP